MEQPNNISESSVKPQGKGFGVAGFVISLVAIILFGLIAWVATMQAVEAGMKSIMGESTTGGYGISLSWLVLSVIGLVLSVVGMTKLKKSGAKRGLAIAGLVISIITTLLCIVLVIGIKMANDEAQRRVDAATEAIKNFDMQKFADELNATTDSLNIETDSTAH